ncbi:endonuclease/exonuclease/phosphatase family protein [Microlunatus soli]|nr:endonuclease/exonuclease/phosphatase family protein [Microlunatus soli]
MTYNVHRWRDDRAALATVIRACSPDLAMIQEAPTWWGTRRRRLAFAREVGLHYIAGRGRSGAFVKDPGRWEFRTRWIRRPLIRRGRKHRTLQVLNGAVAARTTVDRRTLTVIGCHLGLHNQGRIGELNQVLELAPLSGPYLVVGDINERLGGPVWKLAADTGLIDQHAAAERARPTFPAAAPQHRIDVVWATPDVSSVPVDLTALGLSPELIGRASDHVPVVVDLTLTATTG